MTELEALRELQALRAARAATMTHTQAAPSFSGPPQEPPGAIGGPLGVGQAFQAGRAANEGEIRGALGGETTTMPDGGVYWRKDEASPWQPVDQPGFGMSDAARVAGKVGPEMLASTLALLGGGPVGFGVNALRMGAGAVGGRLLDEGSQYLEGWQNETPQQVGKKALETGAITTGLGYLTRFLPGSSASLSAQNARSREMLGNAIEFQATHPNYPPLIPADILIQTGYAKGTVPPNVMRAIESQAENLSGAITNVKSDAAQQAASATERYFATPPTQAVLPTLRRAAEAGKAQVDEVVQKAGPGAERAASAFEGAGKDAATVYQAINARNYGQTAKFAAQEKPIFDLSPAQRTPPSHALDATALRDTGILDAQGRPIMAQVTEKLREFSSGEDKIRFVRSVLREADPLQTDYLALKDITTAVGEVVNWDPIIRAQKDHPGKQLWGTLKEITRSPVNKDQTPKFLESLERADTQAKHWYDLRDRASVGKLFESEPEASRIIAEIANDPEAILTGGVREVLMKAPAKSRIAAMKGVQRRMLEDPDVFDKVTALETTGNKDVMNMLFGNAKHAAQFKEKALNVSQFWNSDLGKMMKAQSDSTALYDQALSGIRNADEAKRVLAAVQSPEDLDLWRKAIVGETVRKVFKPTEGNLGGTATVDPHALRVARRDLQQRGLWDVLDADQQKALVGLEDYYRIAFARQKNVGNSMVTAAVAAGLNDATNPTRWKSFYDAAHEIVIARATAAYLTNPKRAAKYIARINKAPRNPKPWAFGTAVVGPAALETLYAANPDLSDAYDFFLKGPPETDQESPPTSPVP